MFNNKVIIFHNGVAFDAVLINKLFACYGLNVNYAVLDTMNLAYELGFQTVDKKYRQDSLGRTLNIPNTDAHNAAGDCKQLLEIYKALWDKYSGAVIWKTVLNHLIYSKLFNFLEIGHFDNDGYLREIYQFGMRKDMINIIIKNFIAKSNEKVEYNLHQKLKGNEVYVALGLDRKEPLVLTKKDLKFSDVPKNDGDIISSQNNTAVYKDKFR